MSGGVSAAEREATRLLAELTAPSARDVAGEPLVYGQVPEGVQFDVSFPRLDGFGL